MCVCVCEDANNCEWMRDAIECSLVCWDLLSIYISEPNIYSYFIILFSHFFSFSFYSLRLLVCRLLMLLVAVECVLFCVPIVLLLIKEHIYRELNLSTICSRRRTIKLITMSIYITIDQFFWMLAMAKGNRKKYVSVEQKECIFLFVYLFIFVHVSTRMIDVI